MKEVKHTLISSPSSKSHYVHIHTQKKFKTANGGVENITETKGIGKDVFDTDNFKKKQNNKKPIQYKVTANYIKVNSKSNALKSTPKIFKINQIKMMNQNDNFSKSFICKILTDKVLDTDINKRYNFIKKNLLSHEDVCSNKSKKKICLEEKVSNRNRNKPKFKNSIKSIKYKKEMISLLKDNINSDHDEGILDSKEINSFADFYEVSHKKAIVFHLHHPSKFNFHGQLKITLLAGGIEILGFNLNEFSKFREIILYSPELYTPLVVESKSVDNKTSDINEIIRVLEEILPVKSINSLLENFNPDDAILMVEQIDSTFAPVIHNYLNISLFPKSSDDFLSLFKSNKLLESSFICKPSIKGLEFKKHLEWDKIILNQCTVFCGGKGVGKSTLLKYYVNQSICHNEKVLVLDFDPGQPEFTPSGFMSAVLVDKPLLGPNFTHIMNGELMVYYGLVNAAQAPTKYLKCIDYIIKWCRKNEDLLKVKWFVNTMGFCKGIGVEFMITILKLVKPNTVIQICSNDDYNNYPFYLTPFVINCRKCFLRDIYDDELTYDLSVITSQAEAYGKPFRSLNSSELRDIMTISYLSQMLSPPFYNFNAVIPYSVSFSNLYLGIDSCGCDIKDILRIFNGNLVSLSHFEKSSEEILSVESESDDYFKIILKPEPGPSLGLGFVRGIDKKNKKIYIITHLSVEELSRVNCLTLGSISPPSCMFLNQKTIDTPEVYTCLSNTDRVRKVTRIFRYKGHCGN